MNIDRIIGTNENYLGYNLYAYCENNPINNIDSNGDIAGALALGAALLGGLLVGTATYYAVQAITPVANHAIKAINNTRTQSKAQEKTEEKVITTTPQKNNAEPKPCTTARITQSNNISRGYRLTINEAQQRVDSGGSVMCDAQSYALQVVQKYKMFVHDNPHGGYGYYPHYHPKRSSHVHIWYLP